MLLISVSKSLQADVDQKLVKSIAETFQKSHLADKNALVELNIVGAKKMRSLNKKFRKIDKTTDVLSFNAAKMPIVKGEPELLGEIFICWPKVKQQAKDYGHSERRELGFLLVHGLLHLLGYDHQRAKDEKKMSDAAELVLSAVRLDR